VAAGFFTVEVWTDKGLPADGLGMSQNARNLTGTVHGLLAGKRCVTQHRLLLFTVAPWRCANRAS